MLLRSVPEIIGITSEVLMSLWHFLSQNRFELFQLTVEHVWLVGVSMFFAVLVGIPLGILV